MQLVKTSTPGKCRFFPYFFRFYDVFILLARYYDVQGCLKLNWYQEILKAIFIDQKLVVFCVRILPALMCLIVSIFSPEKIESIFHV